MAGALDDLTLLDSGKVRELYEIDAERLLLVASDRVSTYDAVHPTAIPILDANAYVVHGGWSFS